MGGFSSTSISTTAANGDVLTINSGVQLTVNGSFTVGPPDNTASTSAIKGFLTAGPVGSPSAATAGSLVVNGTFTVAQPSNNSGGKNITTADLSGLNSLTVNAPTGMFLVGYGANTQGQLTLPARSIMRRTILRISSTSVKST